MPLALRTILTWFVIGPVSRVFKSANGGCPSNTWVLPLSFRVNQTCLLSGVAAMLGQNGLVLLSQKAAFKVFENHLWRRFPLEHRGLGWVSTKRRTLNRGSRAMSRGLSA